MIFGEGFAIVCDGPIVVSGSARICEYYRINGYVNIIPAWVHGEAVVPQIGNSCDVEPWAKLYEPIELKENIVIGANAVLNNSLLEGNCTSAGVLTKNIK